MQTFDTRAQAIPIEGGKKTAVLHNSDNVKIRIVELAAGGAIPTCEMSAIVIFHVLSGAVEITANGERSSLVEGQGVFSGPATVSMVSATGARLMGIQIEPTGGRA